jgi:hypothetical protein
VLAVGTKNNLQNFRLAFIPFFSSVHPTG